MIHPLTKLGLAFVAVMTLCITPLWAGNVPKEKATTTEVMKDISTTEVLFRQGYAEIIYDPEYIPVLGLRVGIKTLILLPSDERIVRIEVGLRGTALDIKNGQNWVGLRPNIERINTNLHIATDQGRVYSFDLIEGGGPHKEPHKKVVVLRPDMDLDAEGGPINASPMPNGPQMQQRQPQSVPQPVQQERQTVQVIGMDDDAPAVQLQKNNGVPGAEVLRKLDNGYKISNQKPKVLEVQKVYNDGQRTFVIFKTAMLEAPLFYRIDPNGKREILTYRMEASRDPRDPDLFVIPRLVDKGTVKVGDFESTFIWKKAE